MSDDEPTPDEVVSGDLDGGEDDRPVVSRADARESRADAKRRKLLIWSAVVAAAILILVLVFVLVVRGGTPQPTVPSSTTSTTTTSSTTTTIAPELATAVMPLTGIPVDGDDPSTAEILKTPALAVKIDNDPAAQPYVGLEYADIVFELRVEGISRNIAVFHSLIPDTVGPVRSARTSDPDLLAMLVKPVFSWSGGNPTVMKVIRSTPWIVDASHSADSGQYFRERSRKAPYNLMIEARALLEKTGGEGLAPRQIFEYVPHDEKPTGVPVSGVSIGVGATHATFDWDPDSEKWIRQFKGGPQKTQDDEPIAVTNVVVLATEYTRSHADSRSPEARSLGGGNAWVFADGMVTAGKWMRADREQSWMLIADDGSSMRLVPGNTWVLLPDRSAGTPVVD